MIKHLKDVRQNYFTHLKFALSTSCRLFLASFYLLIHAFFPFWFIKNSSNIVKAVVESFPKSNNLDRILVRFNNKWQNDPKHRKWRVLVNGDEILASEVIIKVNSISVEEPVNGEIKYHLKCYGKAICSEDIVEITN